MNPYFDRETGACHSRQAKRHSGTVAVIDGIGNFNKCRRGASDEFAAANARLKLGEPSLKFNCFIQLSQFLVHEFIEPSVDALNCLLADDGSDLWSLGRRLLRGSPLDDSADQAAATRTDAVCEALRVGSDFRWQCIKAFAWLKDDFLARRERRN